MAASGTILHFIRRLGQRQNALVVDQQLLRAFVTQRDETAFASLVERHGPMVLGVCRRMLAKLEDAEDVFQATFLVLARKAGGGQIHNLASWLHGVAFRLAQKSRVGSARRWAREQKGTRMASRELQPDEQSSELRQMLDEELQRLPARYRAPLILCYLEGKSRKEAADQLGCSEGVIKGNLERGRERLRELLVRRGIALSALGLVALLEQQAAAASVPVTWVGSTAQAAVQFAAGQVPLVSAHALSLAKGLLLALATTKLKMMAFALVVVFGFLATSLGLFDQEPSSALGSEPVQPVPPQVVHPARPEPAAPAAIPPAEPRAAARTLAIRHWKAIGPFAVPKTTAGEQRPAAAIGLLTSFVNDAFQRNKFPPDTVVDLNARYKGPGHRELAWTDIRATDEVIDFIALNELPIVSTGKNQSGPAGLAYFSSWIHAPEDITLTAHFPAYADGTGGKVCVRVFTNGKAIKHRQVEPGNKDVVQPVEGQEVALMKGWTHLYAKVWSTGESVRMGLVLHGEPERLSALTAAAVPPGDIGQRFTTGGKKSDKGARGPIRYVDPRGEGQMLRAGRTP